MQTALKAELNYVYCIKSGTVVRGEYGLERKVKADNINHDLLSMAAAPHETTHADGDNGKVAAGGDAAKNVSVWVLCQVNNAIGQAISDVPSV